MRVWIRFIPIISVAFVAEIQLHDFPDFGKKINRFVDSRQAGCWEVGFYLFENILYARVASAFCQNFQYSKSLGRYAKVKIL